MSWTSPSETPPPRPDLDPDVQHEPGFDVIDHGAKQLPVQAGDQAAEGDRFSESGPLDPSIFDGLFADLDRAPERDDRRAQTASGDGRVADDHDRNGDPDPLDRPAPDPVIEPGDERTSLIDTMAEIGLLWDPEPGKTEPGTALFDVGPALGPEAPDPDPGAPGGGPAGGSSLLTPDRSAGAGSLRAPTGEYPAIRYQPRNPPPRWRSFAAATAIGALIGVAGALLLSQLLRPQGAATEAVTPAPLGRSESTASQPASPAVAGDPAGIEPARLLTLAATGRFELNTIRFVPGTLDLTEDGRATLNEVSAVMADRPGSPLSITVRTYSEPTAIENLTLSVRQADAIADHLIERGTPASSLTVTGLGAPPLSPAQPVQNFVVVNTGLRQTAISTVTAGLSPFAIGLDPLTNQLRPESIDPLNTVGRAMSADTGTSISLAAYAYGEPDASRNRELASVAAEAVAVFLITNHGIDRQRISILTPGQAPYIVGSDVGNHIVLQWGQAAEVSGALGRLDREALVFAPGSMTLGPEARETLDRVMTIMVDNELTLVVDVHTSTGTDADVELSDRQAAAIGSYLVDGGMPQSRVRVFGGGYLRQFRADGLAGEVVLSAVP